MAKADIETAAQIRQVFLDALGEEKAAAKKQQAVEGVYDIMEVEDLPFSLKNIPDVKQIEDNFETVAKMTPVISISADEFKKGPVDLVTQVETFFNSIGNKVVTKHGNIKLDKRGVKSSLGHGIGKIKAAAYKAVPEVLKNGEIVDYQINWKNRGYNTAVFAAPVTIGGIDYFEAAVVNEQTDDNEFYLHEVLLINEKGNVLSRLGPTNIAGTPRSTSPLYSILKKLNDVKKKFFDEENDKKYLAAVNSGDMETAQKLVDQAAKAAGYTIKAYHGTPNGTFTVFKSGQYFTENREYADIYQNQGASSNGYESHYMGVMLQDSVNMNRLYLHNVFIEKKMRADNDRSQYY